MSEQTGLLIETITNGPFAENCYLVADKSQGKGILIDPGDEAMHAGDRPVLEQMPLAAKMFGLGEKEVPDVDREINAGDNVAIGAFTADVLHTPGHSPGGCCLHIADQEVVFVGDTLFAGSIGRTDLPGGDLQTLLSSIRNHLLSLSDDVVVYSGHGPETTIGTERKVNPFLQPGFAD